MLIVLREILIELELTHSP